MAENATLVSPRWIDRPVKIHGHLSNREPAIKIHGKEVDVQKIPDLTLPNGTVIPEKQELQRIPSPKIENVQIASPTMKVQLNKVATPKTIPTPKLPITDNISPNVSKNAVLSPNVVIPKLSTPKNSVLPTTTVNLATPKLSTPKNSVLPITSTNVVTPKIIPDVTASPNIVSPKQVLSPKPEEIQPAPAPLLPNPSSRHLTPKNLPSSPLARKLSERSRVLQEIYTAPLGSVHFTAARAPTLPILDLPTPKLKTVPIEPEKTPLRRLPLEYIPPFVAVNPEIPISQAEPRISFPPSPAEQKLPDPQEYELEFMRLNRDLGIIKRKRPHYAVKLLEHGQELEIGRTRLKELRKYSRADDTNFRWQAFLIAGFLGMEWLNTQLGIPAGGLTYSQYVVLPDYEEILIELGESEVELVPDNSSPMTKLMWLAFMYYLMFLGTKWLMSYIPDKKQADELSKGMWQLMRGNSAEETQEGGSMERNPFAKLITRVATVAGAFGYMGEKKEELKAKVVPDVPQSSD